MKHDPEKIAVAIETMHKPGDTFEVRALEVQGFGSSTQIHSGYFQYNGNNAHQIANEVAKINKAKGIYFTLNPVDPVMRAKANGKMLVSRTGSTTSDTDIVRRTKILLDIDPIRKSNTSATDEQVKLAKDLAPNNFPT